MFLVLLSYLAFFSIALPDSMLGVAWPSMRLSFGQSLGAAGLIPPFGVAATIVSTLLTRHAVTRLGIGRLLAISTVLSAVGLVVSAVSPTMPVFLVSVILLGLSGGAIDVTLNAYAARHFGPRRINLMHASYVIGAAASPALVTVFLQVGVSWRVPYLVIACLQLLLAGVFAVGVRRWDASSQPEQGRKTRPRAALGSAGRGPTRNRHPRMDIAAVLGIATVVVQTGIESSVALWAYSFLTLGAGVSAGIAGAAVSGFWLMMFVSRVVLGSFAERLGSRPTMGAGAIGLVLAAVLTFLGVAVPAAGIAGVLVFGLAAGPMYPLLILTTRERTMPDGLDRLVAVQAAASAVGAATLLPLFGLAMSASPSTFAPIMLGAVVAAAGLHLALRRCGVRSGRSSSSE
ncbi:MAG: MFS transporter [Microlunatus sp.]